MTTLQLDPTALAEARRFNGKLAWAPRFRMRHRLAPRALQALLVLSQLGADRKLRRAGIDVDCALARDDGLRIPLRVPVRILRPAGQVRGVVLDIHGGGWVIGNARMDDGLNAALAAACGMTVVSVDYRLAGPVPLQAVMDDCLAAARWLLADGLPETAGLPIVVLGESAGAHLAAATLLRLKAWPELLARVRGAVLYYGVYDLTGTPSVRQAGPETLVLDGPGIVPGLRQLTPDLDDATRASAPFSPLHGDLAGLPPALMFAGALDPLRDDTQLMARRWAACAPVESHLVPEAPHGFIRFPTYMARAVQARAHAWIRERVAQAPAPEAAWR